MCEGNAKFEWKGSSHVAEYNSFDLTVTGTAAQATITNNEDFALDVYVKAGSEQSGAGTSGPFTVDANSQIQVTGTSGKDISAIGIVCEGTGVPDFPPFTLPNNGGAGNAPGGGAGNSNGGPPANPNLQSLGWLLTLAGAAGVLVLSRRND